MIVLIVMGAKCNDAGTAAEVRLVKSVATNAKEKEHRGAPPAAEQDGCKIIQGDRNHNRIHGTRLTIQG